MVKIVGEVVAGQTAVSELDPYRRSLQQYKQLGYPQYAGKYEPIEVPSGYRVKEITETPEGLSISFEAAVAPSPWDLPLPILMGGVMATTPSIRQMLMSQRVEKPQPPQRPTMTMGGRWGAEFGEVAQGGEARSDIPQLLGGLGEIAKKSAIPRLSNIMLGFEPEKPSPYFEAMQRSPLGQLYGKPYQGLEFYSGIVRGGEDIAQFILPMQPPKAGRTPAFYMGEFLGQTLATYGLAKVVSPILSPITDPIWGEIGYQFRQHAPERILRLAYGKQLAREIAIERAWDWSRPAAKGTAGMLEEAYGMPFYRAESLRYSMPTKEWEPVRLAEWLAPRKYLESQLRWDIGLYPAFGESLKEMEYEIARLPRGEQLGAPSLERQMAEAERLKRYFPSEAELVDVRDLDRPRRDWLSLRDIPESRDIPVTQWEPLSPAPVSRDVPRRDWFPLSVREALIPEERVGAEFTSVLDADLFKTYGRRGWIEFEQSTKMELPTRFYTPSPPKEQWFKMFKGTPTTPWETTLQRALESGGHPALIRNILASRTPPSMLEIITERPAQGILPSAIVKFPKRPARLYGADADLASVLGISRIGATPRAGGLSLYAMSLMGAIGLSSKTLRGLAPKMKPISQAVPREALAEALREDQTSLSRQILGQQQRQRQGQIAVQVLTPQLSPVPTLFKVSPFAPRFPRTPFRLLRRPSEKELLKRVFKPIRQSRRFQKRIAQYTYPVMGESEAYRYVFGKKPIRRKK